jgi:hypothetical protein
VEIKPMVVELIEVKVISGIKCPVILADDNKTLSNISRVFSVNKA